MLKGVALGVTVSGIPLLVLLGMHARHVAQAPATSAASPTGGHAIQVISRSQSTSFGWLVLLLVIVAVCGVAAVLIRRQPASQRMASGRG